MSEHDPNVVLSLQTPWKENANLIWIASSLALRRNLENYNFPSKMDADQRGSVFKLLGDELTKAKKLASPYLVPAPEAPPLEKEFIFEHFLLPFSPLHTQAGEGFVLDSSGTFLSCLNMEDHLLLQVIDCSENLEEAWNGLMLLESSLGERLKYSYSRRFGFLTSDPAECGTAFDLAIHLQLPAMIHGDALNDFLMKHSDESIFVSGIQGTLDEIVGDVVVLRNNMTLGLSEEDILASLRSYATKLVVFEQGLRSKMKSEQSPDFMDLISRAYGMVMHSYQIEVSEALGAISLLKLGVDLGWMSGVSIQELNALFFNCRRAHLLRHFKNEVPQEELSHKRAEYIHTVLKRLKLNI
ncbi:MAG: protein arginine kinase [Chlamydiia bacterium]|nr:protein arginine kinase [Chlamydiia bacterium]